MQRQEKKLKLTSREEDALTNRKAAAASAKHAAAATATATAKQAEAQPQEVEVEVEVADGEEEEEEEEEEVVVVGAGSGVSGTPQVAVGGSAGVTPVMSGAAARNPTQVCVLLCAVKWL